MLLSKGFLRMHSFQFQLVLFIVLSPRPETSRPSMPCPGANSTSRPDTSKPSMPYPGTSTPSTSHPPTSRPSMPSLGTSAPSTPCLSPRYETTIGKQLPQCEARPNGQSITSYDASLGMLLHFVWCFTWYGASLRVVLHLVWCFTSCGASLRVVLHLVWCFTSCGAFDIFIIVAIIEFL